MQSEVGSHHQKSQNSGALAPCPLWPVDLKITHLDWNPEATLIHFQGQYLTLCELDYNVLQAEIQKVPKTNAALDIGEFCLVEDSSSARWYRGRVQNRKADLFDVFLIDHGNVLSVGAAHVASCSNDLLNLPPKIVCGFLANVLLLQSCSLSVVEQYLSSLIGSKVAGYIQALLPHNTLLLEAPDINSDLVRHGFGRYVDADTFLLLVEMLTDVPLQQNVEPVPDLLVDKTREQAFRFRPPGFRGDKDILSFCGPTLSCGTRVKVRVAAAVSPGLFYCQMASASTDLQEMSKKLSEACEYETKPGNPETQNLSLLCSVKAKDGKWHRGSVHFLPVNSQLRVLLIDYGFFESVKVEDVHRLPADFCTAPIMAFPCSLHSLCGQDEAAKTQQLGFLKAGLLGGVLDVEISSFDKEQHLYSITVFGAQDNDEKPQEPVQEPPGTKVGSGPQPKDASPRRRYTCSESGLSRAFGEAPAAEELQADSVFVGYVVHVQNPNQFWITAQKRYEEFVETTRKMADHFGRVQLDEDVLLNPEPGTLCCAVYEEDLHFYRAVVTNRLAHGAEVLFIDFGNTEKVPRMLIKKIPETFARKSAFAFCCSLNVVPLSDVWTSAATDAFRKAVSDKELRVRVVRKKKIKYVVDLHETGRDDSPSISELLVSSKQADYWNSPNPPVAQGKEQASEDPGSPGRAASDEDTCQNPTEAARAASFAALGIRPGWELAVCCSYIRSPTDFWCQPLKTLPALQEMMRKVGQYYSAHTVPLQPGESCCVTKSPADGRWYRAVVTGTDRGQANVLCVDYGFTVRVSEHSLQAIKPEYVGLEGQAFRCSLHGLAEPAELRNHSRACSSLKEFVRGSAGGPTCKVVWQVQATGGGLCNIVDLYHAETRQSATEVLVKEGVAKAEAISEQLPTAFPESFVYCSYELSPGKEEAVYVSHVGSPWQVYCQLERNAATIEGLEKKIAEQRGSVKQAGTKVMARKLCLAEYCDGRWYRGLARPTPSPLHLAVFFVDYGNLEVCEKSRVAFIPRDSVDLLCTPVQAVRFRLASVSDKELSGDAKKWLEDTVLDKQARAVVVATREDGSFDVELFHGDIHINEKVREIIRSRSPKSVQTKRSGQCKGQEDRRPLNSLRDSEVRRSAHKRKGYTKKTPRNRRTKGKQTKSCDATEQRGPPQRSPLPDRKLAAGFRAKCFASHFESVTSFYLQLSEDEAAILKIADELNSDVVRGSLEAAASPRINDLVVAEHEEDGALYRSVVRQPHGTSCLVEFIDYGNSASVEKMKIYTLPEDYRWQPRLSISCSLLDTSAHGHAASFTEAVMEKPLMVQFVRRCGSQWEVEVDVLDAAVLPEALEAEAVAKNKEEHPASSAEPSDDDQPGKQQEVELRENEAATRGNAIPAAEAQHSLKPGLGCSAFAEGEDAPQNATLFQQNPDFTPCPAEPQKEATEGEANVETGPPQRLVFAPIGRDKSHFGFASAVMTPSEFSVVLEDSLPVIKTVSIMLRDLPTPASLPEAHLTPGACCLLRSDGENKWCRAEIVSADTSVVLKLVDCGERKCVPYEDLSKLRRLPEELVNVPKAACPCTLRGVKPVGADGGWTDEAALFFQQRLCQKNLQIFFRELVSNTHWKVDIMADGVHVAKELVDAGHATYLDVMLELRFQEKASPQDLDGENEPVQLDKSSGGKMEGRYCSAESGTSRCLRM